MILQLNIQLSTTAGLPANVLRHSHRHLLVLTATPIRQRTTADLNMSSTVSNLFAAFDSSFDVFLGSRTRVPLCVGCRDFDALA